MSVKEIFKKGSLQLLGMVLFALGVALIVYAGAGASPLDAVANYSSRLAGRVFNEGFFTQQGTWTTIWNIIFALIVLLLTRKWKVGISIVVSILIGFIIDGWMGVILPKVFQNIDIYTGKTIFQVFVIDNGNIFGGIAYSYAIGLLGLLSLALGISTLIVNKLFLTPYDDMSLYLETKTGKYSIAKSILDGSSLLIAIVLGLILGDVWNQIHVFSFVVVFGLGPLIGLFIKLFTPKNKEKIEDK